MSQALSYSLPLLSHIPGLPTTKHSPYVAAHTVREILSVVYKYTCGGDNVLPSKNYSRSYCTYLTGIATHTLPPLELSLATIRF